jgi:hypothetical protein
VSVLPVEGDRLNADGVLDLLVDASAANASTVAVPCARLDPGFFELRTGAAGEIVQKFATYRMRLAIIGPLPPEARSSNAFVAFVREANRGSQTWFMETMDELQERLAGTWRGRDPSAPRVPIRQGRPMGVSGGLPTPQGRATPPPPTSVSRSRREDSAISSTQASNASWLARDGTRYPLTLRTNWSAAARTSSSVAAASGRRRVLMLRHMPGTLPRTRQYCTPRESRSWFQT